MLRAVHRTLTSPIELGRGEPVSMSNTWASPTGAQIHRQRPEERSSSRQHRLQEAMSPDYNDRPRVSRQATPHVKVNSSIRRRPALADAVDRGRRLAQAGERYLIYPYGKCLAIKLGRNLQLIIGDPVRSQKLRSRRRKPGKA